MSTGAVRDDGRDGGARLAAEVAEAERLERERLAEALHDDALQRVMIARQDLAEAEDDPAMLASVQVQLEELTTSLRTLTQAMHEDTLASLPLSVALGRLASDGMRRGRLSVHTYVDPAAAGDHDPFLLGVVRELLANVVKHADARTVDIAITVEERSIIVRVADDGRGMTREEVERAGRAGHLGHARLRRRLDAIQGTVVVDSVDRLGTTVTCTIPLQNLRAQRTLEDALRRERRWSAALVAAMQDGFVVFRDGRAVQVNDRFCAMTGFTREELTSSSGSGRPFWPQELDADFDALVDEAQRAGGSERQSTVVRRDGSRFPALVAGRAMLDDMGGYAGMLVTVKDITGLQLAAERRRLADELSAIVATTNRLRGLLDAARAVVDAEGEDRLLDEIARTISQDLGWAVVIHLYRPAWDDFIVTTGHGVTPDGWEVLEGSTHDWAQWTPLLDERFAHRGAYFVPAGSTGGIGSTDDTWQPDDVLLIPFRHSQGHFLGILSLDSPASQARPTAAELDVLVAIAAHAALAVQHAQTAIESARHAAALDRLLHVSSHIAATREITPMLDVVAQAISDALGFGRVVIEVADEAGMLRPRAIRDTSTEDLPTAPLAPRDLAGVFDEGFATEGCFLFTREEAMERLPPQRAAMVGSRRSGAGWRAWDDHVVVVPLHGGSGQLVGLIWVDDPDDRLLPPNSRLQALHAFANQATAAMIAADRYERMATVSGGDPLTRLGNRRAFQRELEREIARSARAGTVAVLVLADVEGCAALEDDAEPTERNAAAPELVELAEAFEAEMRRTDRAFRLEGSLFAMLLSGSVEPPETTAVTVRLAARLRSLGRRDGMHVHFGTARIGAAGERAETVLHRAGQSLLEARRVRT